MADQTLDAKGLNCPLPILKAKKALTAMPAGATLERNYFLAPETDSHSVLYLCRFEPSMFAKMRLTQSCK